MARDELGGGSDTLGGGSTVSTTVINNVLANGVMLGVSPNGNPSQADFATFNAQIGPRAVDLAMFFNQFPAEPLLYGSQQTLCNALGMIPQPAWQPTAALSSYTNGSQDAALAAAVATAKSYGKVIICRLAHEFNGTWNPYGHGSAGETPTQFITGWKYIVDYFRTNGATNVQWVWSANIWGGGSAIDPSPYYPGDNYVDYVGLDGYMNLNSPSATTFSGLFLSNYAVVTALSSRPFMIAETGIAEDARINKAQWYRDMAATIRASMPRCVALQYFNRAMSNGEGDYSIDTSGTNVPARTAFTAAVNDLPAQPRSRATGVPFGPPLLDVNGRLPAAIQTSRSEASWVLTGAIAENYSRLFSTNNDSILTSGRLRLIGGVVAPTGKAVNHVTLVNGSTDAVTTTHSWVCLVDQNLNVLVKSNDITSNWASFTTKTWDLVSAYTPTIDTPVYIGLVVVAATMPSPRGLAANSILTALTPRLVADSTTGLVAPATLGATAAALAAPASGAGVIPWVSIS